MLDISSESSANPTGQKSCPTAALWLGFIHEFNMDAVNIFSSLTA